MFLPKVKVYRYTPVTPTRIPIQKKVVNSYLNLEVSCGTIPRETQPWQTLGFFSVSRASSAEPHPHEVRNIWPEALGV
jgi:hypothetical protein